MVGWVPGTPGRLNHVQARSTRSCQHRDPPGTSLDTLVDNALPQGSTGTWWEVLFHLRVS